METQKYSYLVHKNFNMSGLDSMMGYDILIATSYLKLKFDIKGISALTKNSLMNKVDNEVIYYFIAQLPIWGKQNKISKDALSLYNDLPNDNQTLKELIFSEDVEPLFSKYSALDRTPNSISKLALKILDINKFEKFADLCTGTGSVITDKYSCKSAYGCDINKEALAIASIRASLDKRNITIENKSAFSVNGKFDKIFCSYPFAMRKFAKIDSGNIKSLFDGELINKVTSCD